VGFFFYIMEIQNIIQESFYKDLELPDQDPVITIQNKVIAYPSNFICIIEHTKN